MAITFITITFTIIKSSHSQLTVIVIVVATTITTIIIFMPSIVIIAITELEVIPLILKP